MNAALALLMSVAAATVVASPRATACSIQCRAVVTPSGGEVPANLPALRWSAMASWILPPNVPPIVVTEILGDGSARELPVDLESPDSYRHLARFTRPLIEGATYNVTIATPCYDTTPPDFTHLTFRAGPEAPLPEPSTSLGKLSVTEQSRATCQVRTASGSCTSAADVAKRDIRLTLSNAALPWRDALRIGWSADTGHISGLPDQNEDGSPFVDPSPLGLSPYVVCLSRDPGQYSGNEPGEYSLSASATIPGHDVAFNTKTVRFDLECAANADVDPTCHGDNGCASTSPSLFAAMLFLFIGWARVRALPRQTAAA